MLGKALERKPKQKMKVKVLTINRPGLVRSRPEASKTSKAPNLGEGNNVGRLERLCYFTSELRELFF